MPYFLDIGILEYAGNETLVLRQLPFLGGNQEIARYEVTSLNPEDRRRLSQTPTTVKDGIELVFTNVNGEFRTVLQGFLDDVVLHGFIQPHQTGEDLKESIRRRIH